MPDTVLNPSTLLNIPKRKNSLTSFGGKVAEGGNMFLSQICIRAEIFGRLDAAPRVGEVVLNNL